MRLTSYDVCVQGFERLRSRSEFILAIPVAAGMTADEVRDELNSDLQCCDRGPGFDWNAARAVIDAFVADLKPGAFDHIEARDEDDEPCYLFLYINAGADDDEA